MQFAHERGDRFCLRQTWLCLPNFLWTMSCAIFFRWCVQTVSVSCHLTTHQPMASYISYSLWSDWLSVFRWCALTVNVLCHLTTQEPMASYISWTESWNPLRIQSLIWLALDLNSALSKLVSCLWVTICIFLFDNESLNGTIYSSILNSKQFTFAMVSLEYLCNHVWLKNNLLLVASHLIDPYSVLSYKSTTTVPAKLQNTWA